jgi:hypothetical protein
MKEFFRDMAEAIETGGVERYLTSLLLLLLVVGTFSIVVLISMIPMKIFIPVVTVGTLYMWGTKRWAQWMLRK